MEPSAVVQKIDDMAREITDARQRFETEEGFHSLVRNMLWRARSEGWKAGLREHARETSPGKIHVFEVYNGAKREYRAG